ncbi:MAG: universal stress protein [Nitrospiraceae bacterium]|nr:MAG: universal stress protein [Nitrospiraceae bacterium]
MFALTDGKGAVTNNGPNADARDKHLLIAIDHSEDSKRAVLYVAEFLGGFPGFSITLLSIIQVPEEDFFESGEERAAWLKNKSEETDLLLSNYRQILIQSGFPEDKVLIKSCLGDADSLSGMILSFKCDLNCCTVVVGRQHKSKSEEFLFGSISNQLIHEAKNCAVWVIE